MDSDLIEKRLASVQWYHRWEMLPGVTTPGFCPIHPSSYLDWLQVPKDLGGRKTLDIGTWDGPIAFELERRNARVTAIDIHDPRRTGFNVSKEILGSRVEYVQDDKGVYNLGRFAEGSFDLVMFLGVFYHLKHPILAFENISRVLAADGEVLFEGECLGGYAETMDGTGFQDPLLQQVADWDVPLTLCYPGNFQGEDAKNWFIPNLACIRGWLRAAGLELTWHELVASPDATPPSRRIFGRARKVGAPSQEHLQV